MKSEDYGLAGKGIRTLLKFAVAALFIVQYIALIIQLARLGITVHNLRLILIFPVPMIVGLVLLQTLSRAKREGMPKSLYHKCFDWALLTIGAGYACIARIPTIN
ncbi:MAG TPA: hypothetical protein VN612_03610 [Acidobacteriaceae bacterium]|nr:hypothetical protein [Acidobacteriaceae bacterium]